ncbi:hypothetical protein HYDPIDRAFT_105341 [Hydnomerulius pinastri MD-312]|nr:hypothetical protein HYDPIDRAFT_105341 [Hydnomerulius pinastri MD-312]
MTHLLLLSIQEGISDEKGGHQREAEEGEVREGKTSHRRCQEREPQQRADRPFRSTNSSPRQPAGAITPPDKSPLCKHQDFRLPEGEQHAELMRTERNRRGMDGRRLGGEGGSRKTGPSTPNWPPPVPHHWAL